MTKEGTKGDPLLVGTKELHLVGTEKPHLVGTEELYLVGTEAVISDSNQTTFIVLGTFDSKSNAKAFIEANAIRVMGTDAPPLTLYKINLGKALLYRFRKSDLKKPHRTAALQSQNHSVSPLAGRFEDAHVATFHYTKEQRGKVATQLQHQISSFETAMKQLNDKPELRASLGKQLDVLTEMLRDLEKA